MNKNFLFVLCCIISQLSLAQPYGNEWINYNQKYLKIQLVKDGIYRLNFNSIYPHLVAMNIDTANLDPRNFQLFGRGQEQYIYVAGENDGHFDAGDYIEFYGEHNDGWFDSLLYQPGTDQTNPYFSLFTDTAAYYLTWNTSMNNKRMNIETDTQFGSYNADTYYYNEVIISDNQSYEYGYLGLSKKKDSYYTAGEGWLSSKFGYLGHRDYSISTPGAYTNGPDADVTTVTVSLSDAQQNPDHHLLIEYGPTFGSTAVNVTYDGYKMNKFNFSIPATQFGNITKIRYTSASLNPAPASDYTAIAYIDIRYPHLYDLQNASEAVLIIKANSTKTYINATNFTSDPVNNLYDLTGHNRIEVVQNGTGIKVLVPAGGEKKLYLTSETAIHDLSTSDIKRVGNNGSFNNYALLNPDSAYILLTCNKLLSEATVYAGYKQTKGFDVVIVNIDDDLYDQFAYGLTKHPLSIRGFIDYVSDIWSTPPQNLFIIGKSIKEEYTRFNSTNYVANLVPTIGNPPTDNMFTAGLNGTLYEPLVPTGRLSATNTEEVSWYYDKVVEFENAPLTLGQGWNYQTNQWNKEWMKSIMLFGGGSNESEQSILKSYLQTYKSILMDTSYGGYTYEFYKNTTAPIQITLADSIRQIINNGASIMCFFGHASGSSFDVSIDNASTYNNKGKYPLLIANSCYSGDIHEPNFTSKSTSEEFVLIKDKGVIGFLASTDLGFAGNLHLYSTSYFTHLGQTDYGKSIGYCMKQAAIEHEGMGNNLAIRSTCLEMSLQGDPSLVINTHPKPDFAIHKLRTYFTPGYVTTDIDSFKLNVIITNIGKGVNDTFALDVERIYPGGEDTTYTVYVPGVHFKDTITIAFPANNSNIVGLNTFNIRLDYPLILVDEMENIANNIISTDLYITSSDLIPVYPYNYAVLPNTNITLKSSTSDPFAPSRQYIIRLDTTDLYNSPVKKDTLITQAGGVVSWKPHLPIVTDSVVYFWSASPYFTDTSKLKWQEHSFQYIPGKYGWGQDHFFQFKNDEITMIDYNRSNRSFSFVPTSRELTCHVFGNPQTYIEYKGNEYRIDGVLQAQNMCGVNPSIHIAVIDSLTLEPWGTRYNGQNPTNNFGNANDNGACLPQVMYFFNFRVADPVQMDSMISMLNQVPAGDYILAYTAGRGEFQDTNKWKNYHFQMFESLGADSIRYIPDSIPYIFFCKKGVVSSAVETIGTYPHDYISLPPQTLTNNANFGWISSTLIGPTSKWGSLHWQQHPRENPTADDVILYIAGVKQTGEEVILKSISPDTTDLYNLNSIVDASTYPWIKLKSTFQDDSLQTCAQLNRWHVLFDGIPEAALNANLHYSFYKDTLNEGDEATYSIAIENVSDFDMDSLRIKYWVEDRNQNLNFITYKKKDSLRKHETMIDTVKYLTKGEPGISSFWIEVNPEDSLWQLEQYHFNNIARSAFFVQKDKINPILDVTFDGIHILNGDIVSPKPEILVTLKDENLFLALNDTADFALFITDPDGNQSPIHFRDKQGSENLRFTPAVLPDNSCKISYSPTFTQDGIYTLSIQATDISNNKSGAVDYSIEFEVINKSTITEVLNYPNPFSTSTRFVFTLTGSLLPDYFKIQILTVSGKVVREITEDEIGTINIGRNISRYAWDGRDEFGDVLANGIYLYRVITKINGETIEHRSTNADQFFHKGFGKMYIMR